MKNKLTISPKPPKGEDGHKTFSVRLKDDLVAQLEQISTLTGRSRNEVISMLLEYAVENCEISE
jgi:metal-responsive CopG/Arc/MetJ family transcriptional regulator